MSDLISRQKAIDAMANAIWHYPNECYQNLNAYEFAKSLAEFGLKDLPSAQPERKKGKWIPYLPEGLRYKCSECESRYETPWHFCPNCGSYNGGESDDKG